MLYSLGSHGERPPKTDAEFLLFQYYAIALMLQLF